MDSWAAIPWKGDSWRATAIERRDFVKVCTIAAAVGLPSSAAARVAEAAMSGLELSVVWLRFQECTGCTESLLRTSHPALAGLILDLVSLDHHETPFAASGCQAGAVIAGGSCASWGEISSAIRIRPGRPGCRRSSKGRRSSLCRDATPTRTSSWGRCSSS